MAFPTAAILVIAWFFLTPLLRALFWFFRHRISAVSRLFFAHGLGYVLAVAAAALMLPGAETRGMALLLAIGQAVLLVTDFRRMRRTSE